jgi:hypothetical protein
MIPQTIEKTNPLLLFSLAKRFTFSLVIVSFKTPKTEFLVGGGVFCFSSKGGSRNFMQPASTRPFVLHRIDILSSHIPPVIQVSGPVCIIVLSLLPLRRQKSFSTLFNYMLHNISPWIHIFSGVLTFPLKGHTAFAYSIPYMVVRSVNKQSVSHLSVVRHKCDLKVLFTFVRMSFRCSLFRVPDSLPSLTDIALSAHGSSVG